MGKKRNHPKPLQENSKQYAKISESCNTATIDQRNVTSQLNKFQLSGTAKSVKFVFVALVPPYTSNATDWNSVYSTGSYIAFTGDTINNVVNEKWNVEFLGIKSGDYEVRVYSNDASTQKLLVTQPLKVSAPEVIKFTAGSGKTVTLGVGQTATDGGITIILNDVSLTNGLSGLPQASFIVQPDGFEAGSYIGKVDGYIPEGGGGIKDEEAPNGGIRIKINSISQSMNTVTFTVEATEPKG